MPEFLGRSIFPRLTVPVSVVISNLILFAVQFILFLGFLVFYLVSGTQIDFHLELLWLFPLLIVLLSGLSLGFGIIVSSLTTKYRDMTHLVQFGVQLWMYATPIIYPLSEIGGNMKLVVLANPVSSVIETFKYIFLGAAEFNWIYLLYSAVFCVVVLVIGILLFNKVEKNFMDTV